MTHVSSSLTHIEQNDHKRVSYDTCILLLI